MSIEWPRCHQAVQQLIHELKDNCAIPPSFLTCCFTEFYGIEIWVLQRAIQALSKEGKAELIAGESADGSDAGVKFFS